MFGVTNLNGYVPDVSPGSKSGVTTAWGVDLSTKQAADLVRWGVPQTTINTLSPYLARIMPVNFNNATSAGPNLGPKGSAAAQLLQKNGNFKLNTTDQATLFNGAFNAIESTLAAALQGRGVNFNQLPANTQTALVDVAYNYGGSGLPKGIADAVSNRNWNQLSSALSALAQSTKKPRFTDDANLVKQDVDSKALPASGSPC